MGLQISDNLVYCWEWDTFLSCNKRGWVFRTKRRSGRATKIRQKWLRHAVGTADSIGTPLSAPVNQLMFASWSLHISTTKFRAQLLQSQGSIHLIFHPQANVSADPALVSSARRFVYICVMVETCGATYYCENVLGQQHTPLDRSSWHCYYLT